MTRQLTPVDPGTLQSCDPDGLPMPQGLTVTCAAYNAFRPAARGLLDSMLEEIAAHLCKLEG